MWLFQHFIPLVWKADKVSYVLFMFLMRQCGFSFEANFLFSDESLRIPDLLILLSRCLFWDETRPRLCDFNPIYPNATRCDPKKYIVVTLMRDVATEIGQYTLPYSIQLHKI